ncbi:MAG: nicotinate (nicotinamide) nucleotide adenylyltransferase [Rickettsiaceae bacterium]|nr:nicotinate (nicotinamide) nucleotide adenylyltransferase [Rickettsiaceae bacterium]
MNEYITVDNIFRYKNQNLKIGVLGGSFDPAHYGHIHIATKASESLRLDEIWFSISPQNPTKPKHKYEYDERKKMLSDLISKFTSFKILEVESNLGINITSKLFSYLNQELPQIKFYFIMGLDIAAKLESWEGFEKLINLVELVIFSRGGYIVDEEIAKLLNKYPNIKYIQVDEVEISSTQIRNKEQDNDK